MTDIPLRTGSLTPEQLPLVLDAIPLDVTFIDHENIVRYYSESYRIFKREPENIGTDVVQCHSPGSRSRVARLISELASGWRDQAEFLVENDDRFVKTTYIAVRDDGGGYVGCLEIAQYVEDIAKLEESPSPPA